MQKIPSLFIRDWDHDPSKVTRVINPECQWVIDGEGIPTRKWDGTACMIRDNKLYKRYDKKFDKKKNKWKEAPKDFEPCQDPDPITKHQPGWIPVRYETKQEKRENRWFKMAWDLAIDKIETNSNNFDLFYDNIPNPIEEDGTYELCGIPINGNPERLNGLYFIKHGINKLNIYGFVCSEDLYDSIKRFLSEREIEGIVWHHEDGRMAKIKRIDFGLEWPIKIERRAGNKNGIPRI